MPKYLIEASYTAEGAKGLIKGGGTARRAEVQKMVESLGGRLDAFYFVFGENDVHVILDLGHVSPQMIFGHYREIVTPEEAERYWRSFHRLHPPNIVPMAQAS